MIRVVALFAVVLLAACSQADEAGGSPAEPATTRTSPAATATAQPAPSAVAGRAYRYTSLTGCTLVREEREEMPFTETLCAGPGGWALRITDSDARQTLDVVAPDKRETRIDLSEVSGGSFNAFGGTAEWRGPSNEPFAPDSLVVRFRVAEQAHPAPEVAYLLAIRLEPTPCLLVKVGPGPGQNDTARAATDGEGACVHEVR